MSPGYSTSGDGMSDLNFQHSSQHRKQLTPGEALQAIRRMTELSIDSVAEITGFSVEVIESLEQSKVNLSYEHAVNLAQAFNAEPALLLSWNLD